MAAGRDGINSSYSTGQPSISHRRTASATSQHRRTAADGLSDVNGGLTDGVIDAPSVQTSRRLSQHSQSHSRSHSRDFSQQHDGSSATQPNLSNGAYDFAQKLPIDQSTSNGLFAGTLDGSAHQFPGDFDLGQGLNPTFSSDVDNPHASALPTTFFQPPDGNDLGAYLEASSGFEASTGNASHDASLQADKSATGGDVYDNATVAELASLLMNDMNFDGKQQLPPPQPGVGAPAAAPQEDLRRHSIHNAYLAQAMTDTQNRSNVSAWTNGSSLNQAQLAAMQARMILQQQGASQPQSQQQQRQRPPTSQQAYPPSQGQTNVYDSLTARYAAALQQQQIRNNAAFGGVSSDNPGLTAQPSVVSMSSAGQLAGAQGSAPSTAGSHFSTFGDSAASLGVHSPLSEHASFEAVSNYEGSPMIDPIHLSRSNSFASSFRDVDAPYLSLSPSPYQTSGAFDGPPSASKTYNAQFLAPDHPPSAGRRSPSIQGGATSAPSQLNLSTPQISINPPTPSAEMQPGANGFPFGQVPLITTTPPGADFGVYGGGGGAHNNGSSENLSYLDVDTSNRGRSLSDSRLMVHGSAGARSRSSGGSSRDTSRNRGGRSGSSQPYDMGMLGIQSREHSPAGVSKANRRKSWSGASDISADDEATSAGGGSSTGSRKQKAPAVFTCPVEGCNKSFTRAYNLRSHQRTHTNERPFLCEVCGKAFARQHDRKRHEALHSGVKSHTCPGCHKRFARMDALSRHFKSETGRDCLHGVEHEYAEYMNLQLSPTPTTGASDVEDALSSYNEELAASQHSLVNAGMPTYL